MGKELNKLDLINISKNYKDQEVLENISFSVNNGEFLSILGPSGCGKTTLLKIIIGLTEADFGFIFKDGVDITNYKCSERKIGIVFQNFALFENMTILKNVEYALKIHKIKDSRKIALDLLSAVGLSDQINKKPAQLSGGQQQRVAIARTLALNPDIILFDEPMSALDVTTRMQMREELKKIQKNFQTTIIYVTHDQEEAFAMSDRIMILDKGVIAQLDTPENICKHPANDYVKSFVLDNLQAKVDSLSRFANSRGNK